MNENMEGKAGGSYVYLISLVAAVGGFLFGYDLSLISGAIIFMEKSFQLTPATKGLAVSSAYLGSIAGPILGLWMADAFGRKKSLVFASICYMISAIGSALAPDMLQFVIWRMLGGVGVGLSTVISPMYIAEISPAKLRGRLVTVNQLSIVLGINLAVIVCYLLSFGGHWRWMFASEAFPILFLMAGLYFVPRSPRWLAEKNHQPEALKILTRINGRTQAEKELREINEELSQETGHFLELFRPGLRRALLIGIVLLVFSQINGVNMMIMYAPTILLEAGIGSESHAILNAVYINLWIFITTGIAFWLIDRFGRRPILLAGVTGMALAHIFMGFSFYYKMSSFFVLLAMFAGTGSFTLTLAPLSWVILAEIFPNRIRGKAMSLVGLFFWVSAYCCAQFFPMLTDWFFRLFQTQAGAYGVFAGICLSCVLFIWKMLPETKDLSLEEIGRFWLEYQKRKSRGV